MRPALSRFVLLALVWVGCSTPAEPAGAPRKCDKDLDCGNKQYCTIANVCRTDCLVDADCLGPTTTAQCNTHGRCIDTVEPSDAATDDDASKTDGAPGLDAAPVDGDDAAGGGGP